jgi:hypothetical protein
MGDKSVDYSAIYDFLYRIERRISSLEKDAKYIEGQIAMLDDKKGKDFQALQSELTDLGNRTSSIKDTFNNCVKVMIGLSKDLKGAVKKDELVSINAQLEDVKFEEFVTPRDLKRGV